MPVFVAHYRTPNASADHSSGLFEFESASRLGSKANSHDARLRMLEIYGNDALAWTITKIDHRREGAAEAHSDGQLQLDFREPSASATRKRRPSTKRGLV